MTKYKKRKGCSLPCVYYDEEYEDYDPHDFWVQDSPRFEVEEGRPGSKTVRAIGKSGISKMSRRQNGPRR